MTSLNRIMFICFKDNVFIKDNNYASTKAAILTITCCFSDFKIRLILHETVSNMFYRQIVNHCEVKSARYQLNYTFEPKKNIKEYFLLCLPFHKEMVITHGL